MNKVFFIDGGAGRVIAAIPALEKYIDNNPQDDVSIIIGGWDNLLLSNKKLHNKVYSLDNQGLFKNVLSVADEVISPEPYRVPAYYRQECSLAEAFDLLINGDITVNKKPNLFTSKMEKINADNFIKQVKADKKKNKTIVIQPFGRSAMRVDGSSIIDPSARGLDSKTYLKIVRKLSLKYNIVLFAEKNLHLSEDTFSVKPEFLDLRMWMSIIERADYFVGIDSLGQHIARAFDKPGTLIAGSTFPINVSYPDWFNIFEKEGLVRVHNSIRLSPKDSDIGDRYNESCLDLSDEDVERLINSIVTHMEKKDDDRA